MADQYWGGSTLSKDLMPLMAGDTPIDKPTELIGHSITNMNNDLLDRVTAVSVKKVRGKIREYQRTLREAQLLQTTFTMGFGSEGAFWTPLLALVQKGNCRRNIYLRRLCPTKPEEEFFLAMLDTAFNPPTIPTDLVTVNGDTNPVIFQSDAATPEVLVVFKADPFRLVDRTEPLYAVAFVTEECADCEDAVAQAFYAGGGVGGVGDAPVLIKTANRFTSVSTLTTGIANGNVIRSIYADGDVVLAGFADDGASGTAATGGTVFSVDGGTTFTIDTNLTVAINAVGYFDGEYIAVGGSIAGGALIYKSTDGSTWTAVPSDDLPADQTLTGIAVDTDNQAMYIVGTGGTALKGTKSGSVINIQALTPTGVSTTDLHTVAVFGPEHIAVAGASSYYAESFDGGTTWTSPATGGSGTIFAVDGMSYLRYVVGKAAGVLSERTILSDNNYKVKTVQAGVTITGDYRDIKHLEGRPDYFVAVTDDGEVVLLKSHAPGA